MGLLDDLLTQVGSMSAGAVGRARWEFPDEDLLGKTFDLPKK